MKKKKRELSELEQSFLDHLGGEARGNLKKALALAGYAEGTKVSVIIRQLREEILEVAMNQLVLSAPQAAFELQDVINDPVKGGASISLKAAESILNRVGAVHKDDLSIKVPSGGLFILPAKEGQVVSLETEDDA